MHVNIKQKANHKVQLLIIVPPNFVAYLLDRAKKLSKYDYSREA